MLQIIWEFTFWYDWVLCPIYFCILYYLFIKWAKNNYSKDILKYFKPGIILKLIGAVSFAYYHQYIRGGDTFLYFKTSRDIESLIFTDFHRFLSLVFLPTENTTDLHIYVIDYVIYSEPNFFVSRVGAILSFFTFSCYVPTALCFSTLSFIGIWYCFTTVCKIYPHLKKEFALSFLYIPSVIFWGSGLGKDSLTFGSTCLVFSSLIRLLLLPKPKIISNLIYLFIGSAILLIVKSYIFYSFILSFSIGIILHRIVLIKNLGVKIILFPLITMATIGLFILLLNYIGEDKKLGLDAAVEVVLQNNKNLGSVSNAGSAYDLGIDIENVNGFSSIMPVFPKGIFITLFRPFLWEVNGIAMLISAIESTVFFIIFLYVLFKKRIVGIFPILFTNPIAISCLIFTLIFAGFIGISSGNFGTLVRYKIPCIPFFCMLLAILYGSTKKVVDKPLHTV